MNAVLKPLLRPIFPHRIPASRVMDEAAIRDLTSGEQRSQCRHGRCDVCGEWDTELQDGVGACCRGRAKVSLRPAGDGLPPHANILMEPLPFRDDWLPCNDMFATGLALASRALRQLDELRALVVGIDIRGEQPVIRLGRDAPIEIPGARYVSIVGSSGSAPMAVARITYLGCTLEWRVSL